MRRHQYLVALAVCCFFFAFGITAARAGGSSDTTDEGYFCLAAWGGFLDKPDKIKQAIINEVDIAILQEKLEKLRAKYEDDKGGTLLILTGNALGVCDPFMILVEFVNWIDENSYALGLPPDMGEVLMQIAIPNFISFKRKAIVSAAP